MVMGEGGRLSWARFGHDQWWDMVRQLPVYMIRELT